MQPTILLDLNDSPICSELKKSNIIKRYRVHYSQNSFDWIHQLVNQSFTVALCVSSSGNFSRTHLNQLLNANTFSETDVIFISDGIPNPRIDDAMRNGASFHFRQPVQLSLIEELLEEIYIETKTIDQEAANPLVSDIAQYGLLLGSSSVMLKLYRTIRKVAQTQANVLIIGESGTGKELVANTVHLMSKLDNEPFVAINCGALSPELIESELFGHKKGAFTGAERDKKGLFEQAENGTLFLDEVTEMPLDQQVKLLRVLETGEYRPLGSHQAKMANVRIISATNRDPAQAITEGLFREDLYFRLSHFPITVPPLRHRGDDSVGLVKHFLSQLNNDENTSKVVSSEVIDIISAHHWPGNVRELKHTIERAYILANEVIDKSCVVIDPVAEANEKIEEDINVPTGVTLEEIEKAAILQTLESNDGNKTDTAKELGVSVKTLYNKLEKYESP